MHLPQHTHSRQITLKSLLNLLLIAIFSSTLGGLMNFTKIKFSSLLLFIFTIQFCYAAQFPESRLAHRLLDGLKGVEIGGSAHNAFGLNALNVDYTDEFTEFKQGEIDTCGWYLKVDVVAPGDALPFDNDSMDYVISSHVIEHFYDPVKSIKEWLRVTKPGGMIYIIAPHKERTFDRDRPRTPLSEIIQRHEFPTPPEVDHHGHYSVWTTIDFLNICHHYKWPIVCYQDADDKVGNGFTVVLMKPLSDKDKSKKALRHLRKKVGHLAAK